MIFLQFKDMDNCKALKILNLGDWVNINEYLPPERELVWLELEKGDECVIGYMVKYPSYWFFFKKRDEQIYFLDAAKEIIKVSRWAKILSPYYLNGIKKEIINL